VGQVDSREATAARGVSVGFGVVLEVVGGTVIDGTGG
jgi:hypothetical protein